MHTQLQSYLIIKRRVQLWLATKQVFRRNLQQHDMVHYKPSADGAKPTSTHLGKLASQCQLPLLSVCLGATTLCFFSVEGRARRRSSTCSARGAH